VFSGTFLLGHIKLFAAMIQKEAETLRIKNLQQQIFEVHRYSDSVITIIRHTEPKREETVAHILLDSERWKFVGQLKPVKLAVDLQTTAR
jgi:hypothetical protein